MMSNTEFEFTLMASGLTKQGFADLIGVEITAIKRWCSSKSKRRITPPFHAELILRALHEGHINEAWIAQARAADGVDGVKLRGATSHQSAP